MGLFDWHSRKTCGTTEEATCTPKEAVLSGKALVVSDREDDCDKDLVADRYPSIPFMLSDSKTEGKDGSQTRPIKLPFLLQQEGGSFRGVMFQKADGTIVHWKPDAECNNYRLIVENGLIKVIPDENPNIFDDACEGTVEQATHIAAAVKFEDCNGDDKFRLIFIPKDDWCEYCEEGGGGEPSPPS